MQLPETCGKEQRVEINFGSDAASSQSYLLSGWDLALNIQKRDQDGLNCGNLFGRVAARSDMT
jgi:hypothetical protein